MSWVRTTRGAWFFASSAGVVAAVLLGIELRRMTRLAEGSIVASLEQVPPRDYAVVLGCAPRLSDGRKNLYFETRMDAAAELFHRGGAVHLWLSGNGQSRRGNEPAAMRESLIARGVPADRLHLDPEGTRTLDSVLGIGRRFPGQDVWFVSQRFHLERALYLANAVNLPALGYPARDAPFTLALALRERLARLRAVLDATLLKARS